ncbi:MAG: hypothetical protein WAW69_00635 [Polaromonas sp.]
MELKEIQLFIQEYKNEIEAFVDFGLDTPKRLTNEWNKWLGDEESSKKLNQAKQKIVQTSFFKDNEEIHFYVIKKQVDFLVIAEQLKNSLNQKQKQKPATKLKI